MRCGLALTRSRWSWVRGARQQGQGRCLAAHQRPAGKRQDRARGRPIASGRGSHRCRRRRAPHGRGGPRVTALLLRLRSGREVWVGEPLCPTLTVKFTTWRDINCRYDKYLKSIKFYYVQRAGSETSAPACLTDLLFKMGAGVSYHARRWYVHVASAFPLAHHYPAVLAWDS